MQLFVNITLKTTENIGARNVSLIVEANWDGMLAMTALVSTTSVSAVVCKHQGKLHGNNGIAKQELTYV